MWQDYAFTVSSIIFVYGLIPQIKKNYDLRDASFISWQLCILYMIAILLSLVTCFSLKLYLSTIFCGAQIVCWIIIAYQKLHYQKEPTDASTITTE